MIIALACVVLTGAFGFAGWLTVKVIGLGEGQAATTVSIAAIQSDVTAVKADVTVVKHEHRNNGGSSTRDAIDRIERTGNETRDQLNEHLRQSAADSALLAQHLTHPH